METKQKLRKRSASPRARFTANSKNSLCQLNRPATASSTLAAAVIIAAMLAISDASAADEAGSQAAAQGTAIQIYVSADDNALPIGTVTTGESVTPIAETQGRSEAHTSELQSPCNFVCRLLLEEQNRMHTR